MRARSASADSEAIRSALQPESPALRAISDRQSPSPLALNGDGTPPPPAPVGEQPRRRSGSSGMSPLMEAGAWLGARTARLRERAQAHIDGRASPSPTAAASPRRGVFDAGLPSPRSAGGRRRPQLFVDTKRSPAVALSAEVEMQRVADGGTPRCILSPQEQIEAMQPARPAGGPAAAAAADEQPKRRRRPSVLDRLREVRSSPGPSAAAAAPVLSPDRLARFQGATEAHVMAWLNEAPTVTLGSELPWLSIHPHGKQRLIWDLASITLIFYTAMVVPLQLAFSLENDKDDALFRFDIVVDVFFLCELVANFLTGFEVRGRIIFDRREIAKQYLRFWFWVDLLAAFPFTLVTLVYADADIPDYARLARLARLFRVFRILRIISRLEFTLLVRSSVSSIAKFFLVVVLTSHWFSCVFYGIGASVDDSWITLQAADELPLAERYVAAYYWSIMTMTTVGFGDIYAVSTWERICAIFAMFIGAGIFAYGVTNIVGLVANLDREEQLFKRKMDDVNAYMNARELPLQLRGEIRQFFHDARRSRQETALTSEAKILQELSGLLRTKVAWAVNDHFLHKMRFFEGSDPDFVMELALALRMICYPPFEYVFSEGDPAREMFFIFRGSVLLFNNGRCSAALSENHYFGEHGILEHNSRRTGSVRTLTFTELRSLSSKSLLKALAKCPGMTDRIKRLSEDDGSGSSSDDESQHSSGHLSGKLSFLASVSKSPELWLKRARSHRDRERSERSVRSSMKESSLGTVLSTGQKNAPSRQQPDVDTPLPAAVRGPAPPPPELELSRTPLRRLSLDSGSISTSPSAERSPGVVVLKEKKAGWGEREWPASAPSRDSRGSRPVVERPATMRAPDKPGMDELFRKMEATSSQVQELTVAVRALMAASSSPSAGPAAGPAAGPTAGPAAAQVAEVLERVSDAAEAKEPPEEGDDEKPDLSDTDTDHKSGSEEEEEE